jgi:hypothetical protein
MLTFLQFKYFNYIWIYIAMTSSKINQNIYGMIINISFHLNNVGLTIFVSICQGYVDPLHAPTHVLYCLLLLDSMHNPHLISSVRKIFVHVIFLTSSTFLWVGVLASFPRNLSLSNHLDMDSLVDVLENYS